MSLISQREARRLKKRVDELERIDRDRSRRWATEYPGGVHLDSIHVSDVEYAIVKTARDLGHAVVVLPDKQDYLRVYGILISK